MGARFKSTRWRNGLVIGIVVLTLVLLTGVTLFTYMAYQRAAEELVLESNSGLAFVSAERLRDELSLFSQELLSLARTREIYGNNPEEQRAALEQARNRLTIFDGGVVLMDNFGRVRASEPTRSELLGSDWGNRDFFRELLVSTQSTRVFYSDITNDGPNGDAVVVMSVPILRENGEFLGALAGMFQLGTPHVSSFYASIVRLRIGQSSNTYILDSNNRIIYDSNHSEVGHTLRLPEPTGPDPFGTALRARDGDGNTIIAAHARVPGTGWTLLLQDDWNAATKSTQGYARALLLLFGLGMGLSTLGVVVLVRVQRIDRRERERLEQEQRVAGLIQHRLLPRITPILPGWNLAAHHHAVDSAGQDFYDFLLLPDGHLMLCLGHLARDGLMAAHLLSTTRSALRGAARLQLSPAQALKFCNDLLCSETAEDSQLALIYANLDPRTAKLAIANAGFNQPWLCSDREVIQVQVTGIPLGVSLDSHYEEEVIPIQPDQCMLFTCRESFQANNPSSTTADMNPLQEIVAENGGDAKFAGQALEGKIERFTGQAGTLSVDATFLILQRLAEKTDGKTGR